MTGLPDRLFHLSLACALAWVLPRSAHAQTAPCAAATAYDVTELTGLGGPVTRALSINDAGEVAGWALDASWTSRAVRWDAAGRATTLGGGGTSAASGIASDGRTAGWLRDGGQLAALWDAGGRASLLAPLSGDRAATGADVNAGGVTVGWSTDGVGDPTAVIWAAGQRAARRLPEGGASTTYAFGVNDAGDVVGRGDFGTAPFRRALLWRGGATVEVLPTLGGGLESATDISPNGTIAGGGVDPADRKLHGVVWVRGQLVELGLLGPLPTSAASANDCGTAVGEAIFAELEERTTAVVWRGTTAVALNQLIPVGSGWDLHTARGINANGAIIGYGTRQGRFGVRAFLLTPRR